MNRRAFLKLSAGLGAATALRLPRGLALASTLPLPIPHQYFPNGEALLAHDLSRFDLLLLPAYAAVDLIRRGALRRLAGPADRAHDPDGAFTIPYATAVAALAFRGAPAASFADLFVRTALWPDDPRLALGAALLRRGWSPNDTHPGHLAQIEKDLAELRPRVMTHPLAEVGTRADSMALTWTRPGGGETDLAMVVPARTMIIEYDWVIPASSPNAAEAGALIESASARWAAPAPATRLIPLMPLPSAALAQRTAIWNLIRI